MNLNSEIKIGGQFLAAFTQIELEAGDDPYFSNFDPAGTNPFYLSEDLRVFTVTPGVNKTIDGVSLNASKQYQLGHRRRLQLHPEPAQTLNRSSTTPTGTDPFTLFPDQTNALSGDSSVTPTTVNPADPSGTPFANYNFAVARVRLSGAAGSLRRQCPRALPIVRRGDRRHGFPGEHLSFHVSTSDGQPLAPQLGAGNVTIPFFATGNYEANGDFQANVDYSANSINNQPVNVLASGNVWAYYGCYLNIYPTANTITVSGKNRGAELAAQQA